MQFFKYARRRQYNVSDPNVLAVDTLEKMIDTFCNQHIDRRNSTLPYEIDDQNIAAWNLKKIYQAAYYNDQQKIAFHLSAEGTQTQRQALPNIYYTFTPPTHLNCQSLIDFLCHFADTFYKIMNKVLSVLVADDYMDQLNTATERLKKRTQ